MDEQDIPPVKKCRKLLSEERYCRKMFDENGEPLYHANCNITSSSNMQHGFTVLHYELDLFYDTLVVCGCSKCKGLGKNPRRVTLSHYIINRLPKFDGLIPPIVVNNPTGDTKETHRNTSILLAQGKTQVSTLQQCNNKTLTTDPFGNTCEADEISLEVEAGGS